MPRPHLLFYKRALASKNLSVAALSAHLQVCTLLTKSCLDRQAAIGCSVSRSGDNASAMCCWTEWERPQNCRRRNGSLLV